MKPELSDKSVTLCCDIGSCVVSFAEYGEWSKLDTQARERYVKLKKWGWEHSDALHLAAVVEEWTSPQEGAVLICSR